MNKTVELSPRLAMVGKLVPQGARLTDVGTDHAYLPTALIQQKKVPSAIAADLRQGPLARARETVKEYGLTDFISFRLCDGLAEIAPEETDAISIAGMGGETIAHILAQAPWTRENDLPLVLQPMSSQSDLRKWLQENGYKIEKECLAREGDTLYVAMLVRAGQMPPMTPAELEAGRDNDDPLRGECLDRLLNKTMRAMDGLSHGKIEGLQERLAQLTQVRDGLISLKKEWEQ